MAYKMPLPHQGPPFFNDHMAGHQFYSQDGLNDIEFSWTENIDPLLRTPSYSLSYQESQLQKPIQRFMAEPQRNLFFASSMPLTDSSYHVGVMSRNQVPVASLPNAPHARMPSPSLSNGLTSTDTSAGSPGADFEHYPADSFISYQGSDGYALTNATAHSGQGVADSWAPRGYPQAFGLPQVQSNNCVNMSQVQGFVDPQDVAFDHDHDEGYEELQTKIDTCSVPVTIAPHQHAQYDTIYYHSDEGLGASITDHPSPRYPSNAAEGTIYVEQSNIHIDDEDEDAEAEADTDDQDHVILGDLEDEASDTDYTPKSSRSRKRRASKPIAPALSKRARAIKATTSPSTVNSRGQYVCGLCNHTPFKDAVALQRHTTNSHTRAFICVFSFAGCNSTFASKNEWKRHVSTQHLNLNVWVCTLQGCGDTKSGGGGAEFNRKDLFTQHLKRMHAPASVKRSKKSTPEWDTKVRELQTTCLRVKRHPPTELRCPLRDCGETWRGKNCWDERMEHVGKHLEKAAKVGTASEVRQGDDELLVGWATREGIVERGPLSKGYRLILSGSGNGNGKGSNVKTTSWDEDGGEEDAEGEDDD